MSGNQVARVVVIILLIAAVIFAVRRVYALTAVLLATSVSIIDHLL